MENRETTLHFALTAGDTTVEMSAAQGFTQWRDAEGIDRLIRELLQVRAKMVPPHPEKPQMVEGAEFLAAESWWVSPQANGGVVLFVLHRGLGWLAIPLSAEIARLLVTTISSQLPSVGTGSSH